MKRFLLFSILAFWLNGTWLSAQMRTITVHADSSLGALPWLWNDYHETHLLYGYGHPLFLNGPHVLFHDDPDFLSAVGEIRPRFIRVTNYMFENPPSPDHVSNDTTVLKGLWPEFYLGPNTLAGADDSTNYDLSFVDSLVHTVQSYGSEVFMNLSFTPFTLAANQVPSGGVAWPNGIRNGPPSDPQVYGRVMYHFVKHCYEQHGVRWFEAWNEPDPLGGDWFWTGTATELFDMHDALAAEVQADTTLASNIELGCCGFTFNFLFNAFANQFMSMVEQNNTRMDFISYHPYSGQGAGYDANRTTIAAALRDQYVPGAELINTEWGRLGNFSRAQWQDLDFGIGKVDAMIEMLDQDVNVAMQAVLVDIFNDTTSGCCPGVIQLWPWVEIKHSTLATIAMNRIRTANERVVASASNGRALAGWSSMQDTLFVLHPVDTSVASTAIELQVNGLPWSSTRVERFELSETSIQDSGGVALMNTATLGGVLLDSLSHQIDQGSGRLIIWRLTQDPNMGIDIYSSARVSARPMPATTFVRFFGFTGPSELTLWDAAGRRIEDGIRLNEGDAVDCSTWPEGIHFYRLEQKDGSLVQGKLVVLR